MPAALPTDPRDYRCREAAAGLWVLEAGPDGRSRCVISGYQGPALPAKLPGTLIEPLDGQGRSRRYRLRGAAGELEFAARSVEWQEFLPGLFDELHAPFQLRPAERRVLRILLVLLRLPGGGGLLRWWHARRTR